MLTLFYHGSNWPFISLRSQYQITASTNRRVLFSCLYTISFILLIQNWIANIWRMTGLTVPLYCISSVQYTVPHDCTMYTQNPFKTINSHNKKLLQIGRWQSSRTNKIIKLPCICSQNTVWKTSSNFFVANMKSWCVLCMYRIHSSNSIEIMYDYETRGLVRLVKCVDSGETAGRKEYHIRWVKFAKGKPLDHE